MFDEMEIACWVRFVDRFNLLEETYSVHDLQLILSSCLWQLFYIAVATKFIVNNDHEDKDRLHVHLNKIDTGFAMKFHQWQLRHGHVFSLPDDSLTVHEIFKRLNEGILPKFDAKKYENVPEEGPVKSALEFVRRTSEIN